MLRTRSTGFVLNDTTLRQPWMGQYKDGALGITNLQGMSHAWSSFLPAGGAICDNATSGDDRSTDRPTDGGICGSDAPSPLMDLV